MKKNFDCVDMKHKGAEKVQAMLASMTLDEQVAYWEQRGKEQKEQQAAIKAKHKVS